jgi:hypothetical protein
MSPKSYRLLLDRVGSDLDDEIMSRRPDRILEKDCWAAALNAAGGYRRSVEADFSVAAFSSA